MAANIYLGNYYECREELRHALTYVEKQLMMELAGGISSPGDADICLDGGADEGIIPISVL